MNFNFNEIPEPYLTALRIILSGLTMGIAARIVKLINGQ